MMLAPGTKLGPYEVVAPLGAGGMGEVYRAKDTRLGREVAVKVLPQHLSADPEIRARFEREARTVSALNHPHICTLFDVGREGGEAGSGGTDYLVMELIEGETLAARLARGPLPVPEVLRLGAQVADALDRAHGAGVVHRDLKPGNVMLTKSGAKLMDFGLARATDLAPTPHSGTQSPTVGAPLTAEGTIVGTFQYMSPEQLEGREADARSDLWALGCVLYEMVTGRRAFEGRSQASLISAIMSGAPAPLSQVSPMSPPALDRLVGACLAKDPDERMRSAHDVKLQLAWLAGAGPEAAPAPPSRRAARWPALASLAVGALGLAVAAWATLSPLARRPGTVVTRLLHPPDLRLMAEWSSSAISPDGRSVVAVARHGDESARLWLWRLDRPRPVELPSTEGAYFPAWSPDGRSIAFATLGRRGLHRVEVAGGSPTRLSVSSDTRGLSWGSRGVIVFAPSASGPIHRIAADGGVATPVTTLDSTRGEAGHRFPRFLPDGEHFLYVALPRGPNGFAVHVGSLRGGPPKFLLEAEGTPTYAEPGWLVFAHSGKIMAQRFDARRLALSGERVAVDDAPPSSDMTAEPVASASRDRRLLYVSVPPAEAELRWLERGGAQGPPLALPRGNWRLLSLARDGSFAIAWNDGAMWRVDLDRGVPTRLLDNVYSDVTAVVSPDGRLVAIDTGGQGRSTILLVDAERGGIRDSLRTVPALFNEVAGWSADGRTLLTAVLGLGRGAVESSWDLWVVPVDGGEPQPYRTTGDFERFAKLSPDGRWALCAVASGPQLQVTVDSYPVPGRTAILWTGQRSGYVRFLWGREGREVLLHDDSGVVSSVPLEFTADGPRAGPARPLFEAPAGLISLVTRDGERLLVNRRSGPAPGASLVLATEWPGMLKR